MSSASAMPSLPALPLRAAVRRRQIVMALVASATLHLVIFALAAVAIALHALLLALSPEVIEAARPKPPPQPLEIQIVEPPQVDPQLFTLKEAPKPQPQYLDSTGLAKAEKPPEDAPFESDQDMAAASEKAGTGDLPLPSVEGRTDRPMPGFTNQAAVVGSPTEPPAPDVAMQVTPVAPSPEPTPPNPIVKADEPPPADKPVPEVLDNEMAFPPANPPEPEKPVVPELPIPPPLKPQPIPEMARLTTPSPKVAPLTKPAYQSQQEKTRIEGNISNRGKASVDAVRTPLAVYKKQISEAIGSRWLYYVKQRMDVVTIGAATVNFFVTKEGRVQSVRIIDNTSNESFAQLCKQSVREAEFAPAPPETFSAMKDGRLEITFTFNLYPN